MVVVVVVVVLKLLMTFEFDVFTEYTESCGVPLIVSLIRLIESADKFGTWEGLLQVLVAILLALSDVILIVLVLSMKPRYRVPFTMASEGWFRANGVAPGTSCQLLQDVPPLPLVLQ